MNKIIIISLVIIVTGAAILAYSRLKPTTNMAPAMQSEIKSVDKTSMEKGSAKYLEYSANVLEQNKAKRRVLFFYASWCPTCRPADADFLEKEKSFPEDVVLIRANYNDPETDDSEKELARKYQVTYQHTFVQIDSDGNEIAKWSGGKTEELLANLK